jgi:hypothetical protein
MVEFRANEWRENVGAERIFLQGGGNGRMFRTLVYSLLTKFKWWEEKLA